MKKMGSNTTRSRSEPKAPSVARGKAAPDAIEKLKRDHAAVDQLFKQYEKSKETMSASAKGELAGRICGELTVHAQIEEEIFYPAARTIEDSVDELPALLDEAEVEHAGAKDLIEQILGMSPDEALFDARIKVLGEYIKHHVKEEENELFPKVKKAGELDLEALGAELDARSQELKDDPHVD